MRRIPVEESIGALRAYMCSVFAVIDRQDLAAWQRKRLKATLNALLAEKISETKRLAFSNLRK